MDGNRPKYGKRLIAVAVMLAGMVGTTASLRLFLWPNSMIIRNSSGREVREVRLIVRDVGGEAVLSERLQRLAPGQAIVYRHDKTDSRADLRFLVAGTERNYEERYIDLWLGESWVFDILPDGSVKTGYATK